MKLSRTVTYAVQATLQLGRSEVGVPVPCSQLAAEGHMPERFLLQVLRHLVTHGILHSTRGVDGGYSLNRPAGGYFAVGRDRSHRRSAERRALPSFDGADGLASDPQAASGARASGHQQPQVSCQAIKLSDLLGDAWPVGHNGAGGHLTAARRLAAGAAAALATWHAAAPPLRSTGMQHDELARRLELARSAAREAGQLTLRVFPARRSGRRAQGRPVARDRLPIAEAEQLLRARIAEQFPDDGILGEEFGEQPGTSGFRWILDPIDGTKSFIHGVPLYGTLVGSRARRQPA